jgi:hypothetical protein
MAKVVIAEYDAEENALRLQEPLSGVKHHERIRVSIDEPHRNGDRPWLELRGILSPEAGDSLAAVIDEMFGSAE